MRRLLASVACAAVLLACASTGRAERTAKLSDESAQLYSRYRQFMTEPQADRFLAAQSELERRQFIESMKVDELLSQFDQRVQDQVWAQEVGVGMPRDAVLLSWGSPYERELDEVALSKGTEVEHWCYQRGGSRSSCVTLTNGVVTAVEDVSK